LRFPLTAFQLILATPVGKRKKSLQLATTSFALDVIKLSQSEPGGEGKNTQPVPSAGKSTLPRTRIDKQASLRMDYYRL